MIRMFFLISFVLMVLSSYSQDSISAFEKQKIFIKQTGLKVLAGWALINIGTGIVGANNTTGSTQNFYRMNALWNSFNLGAAVAGLVSNNHKPIISEEKELKKQHHIELLFLVNDILDLGYVGTGFYLKHRGELKNSDRLKGYGNAIILQGGFLFLFDGLMYRAEKNNGRTLKKLFSKTHFTFNGSSIGIFKSL